MTYNAICTGSNNTMLIALAELGIQQKAPDPMEKLTTTVSKECQCGQDIMSLHCLRKGVQELHKQLE
jgi:hypothetical protein